MMISLCATFAIMPSFAEDGAQDGAVIDAEGQETDVYETDVYEADGIDVYAEGDVVAWTTEPAVIDASSGAGAANRGTGAVLFDGVGAGYTAASCYGWDMTDVKLPAYFVVDLGAEYEFSAVRIYGIYDMYGQCMSAGNLSVSSDGVTWSNKTDHADAITSTKEHGGSVGSAKYASTGAMYTDMVMKNADGERLNAKARYIRVECTSAPWPQWLMQELQLVKPVEGLEDITMPNVLVDYNTADVIEWETKPYVTNFYSSAGKSNTGRGYALFDGNVFGAADASEVSANPRYYYGCDHAALNAGGTVEFTIDLGQQYEFSAVRIFGKLNQPAQALIQGTLSISDDGENWSNELNHSDSNAGSMKIVEGGRDIIKYGSTNDAYTDMLGSIAGKKVNMSARYIKITVLKTSGAHFGAQELQLIKPDEALETKTAAEINEAAAEDPSNPIVTWKTLPSVTEFFATASGAKLNSGNSDGSILFDGVIIKSGGNTWGAPAYGSDNVSLNTDDNMAYITIDLGMEYEFSAVRVYGRYDMWFQSMTEGNLIISSDTNTGNTKMWSRPLPHKDTVKESTVIPKANGGSPEYGSSGDMYTDMKAPDGSNMKARYIRIQATEVGSYSQWLMQEIQLVKPVEGVETKDYKSEGFAAGSNGYYSEEKNVLFWDESAQAPKVIDRGTTSTKGSPNRAGDKALFDKIVYLSRAEHSENDYSAFAANDYCLYDGAKTWITVDLGREYTFSAIRLFPRWNNWDNSPMETTIYYSDDGTTWSAPMYNKDSYASKRVQIVKYESTGDCYTDLKANIADENYNITARYIKIDITKAREHGKDRCDHVAIQEIMMVKPVDINKTYTVSELINVFAEKAANVDALIGAIGEVDGTKGDAIRAARAAYDALDDYSKTLVTKYDTLKEAETKYEAFEIQDIIDAIGALPEVGNVSYDDTEAIDKVYAEYNALSDVNKNKIENSAKLVAVKAELAGLTFTYGVGSATANLTGTKTAEFTLGGEKTIAKISYNGVDYTEADGYFTQNASGGKTTLTITGSYSVNDYPNWGDGTTGAALKAGKTVIVNRDVAALGLKSGDQLTVAKGKLAYFIAMDNPMGGEHKITVEFEDGTKKTVNLFTTGLNYSNISNPGSTGATDEIAPTKNWRVASAAGGSIDRAFNGKWNDNNSSNFWETNYTASPYTIDGTAYSNNVIWYMPKPLVFYIDLNGNTESYKGVRFYNRAPGSRGSTVGITDVWAKMNEDDEWTKLGTYDLTKQDSTNPLTLTFNEDGSVVDYRFLMFSVSKFWSANASNLNIGEIAIVKPYATVDGADTVTVDIDNTFVTDVAFNFNMEQAKSVAKVTKSGTDIGAANWTFAGSTLTFAAEYIKTLGEGTSEFTVTFDNGNEVPVKITREDIKTVTYYVTGDASGNYTRGSNSLELTAVAGKTALKITANGTELAFTQSGSDITITRYNFRAADIWDNYKTDGYIMVNVAYSDGTKADYRVILKGVVYKATGISTNGFKSDEIEAKTTWTVETDSSHNNMNIAMMFGNAVGGTALSNGIALVKGYNWHSGYSEVNGGATPDFKLPHHLEVDLGEQTEFSGIRYYRRDDNNTAGVWYEIGIYGRNSDTEEWTEIKEYGTMKCIDEYADIKLNNTAKCRYVRFVIQGNGYYPTIKWLRFLTPKSEFKHAQMVEEVVPMDFDLNENAVARVTLNGAGRITNITQGGALVPAEYVEINKDSVSISPYYFSDNGYDVGDEVPFELAFAFGNPTDFKVKVGEVDGHIMTYTAGEHGTLKATAYNSEIEAEEEKASGAKVRNTDKLTFTATADNGYMVDSWTVESTTPVYEVIPDSEKTRWVASASSQQGASAAHMIDGNDDTENNYWHSGYTVVDGKPVPDPNTPYAIELDFTNTTEGYIKNAGEFSFLPRTSRGPGIKDYTLYVKKVGSDEWTEAAKGTLPNNNNKHAIEFNEICNITHLKLVMDSLYFSYAYITEVYVSREKMPTGSVVRRGTATEEFEIDDRFTDMKVSVTFKKMEAGTAIVSTELKNITSDAPASVATGTDLIVNLAPAGGYHVSEEDQVEVTLNGAVLKLDKDYTYDRISDDAAVLTVKNVSGKKLVIKAEAKDYLNHKVMYVDVFGATGSLPATTDVIEGEEFAVAKSTLKLVGYKFAGWSYNGETYKAGDKLTMGTEDIVLSAVWTKDDSKKDESGKTDKPSSGGGGGSSKPSSGGGGIGGGTVTSCTVTINGVSTKVAAGTVIAPPEAPEGYTFKGYYLDEALTVPYANDGVKGSVTLYPAFEKNRSRADLADIKGHWAEEYIASLYEKSIVSGSGDGKYNPDNNITRAEFIQILYNMSKMTSDGSHSFKDVKPGDWFAQAVAWAVNFGITSGTDADTFSPYENITREQMAAMIYRYATLMGADWQTTENGEFADETDIADYAKYQVRWAKGEGIISGRPDGSFGPKDNATRAESAAMLSRLVK